MNNSIHTHRFDNFHNSHVKSNIQFVWQINLLFFSGKCVSYFSKNSNPCQIFFSLTFSMYNTVFANVIMIFVTDEKTKETKKKVNIALFE